MVRPDSIITCVDCGGRAHLITRPGGDPEQSGADEWEPGDIVTYRCEDCHDRWDLVLDDDAVDDP